MALLPDKNMCIILAKNIASMRGDDKTHGQSEDSGTKRHEYLVIIELEYQPTHNLTYKHSLGIFTKLRRSFCSCVAGQGLCRHKAERMWFQYFHWTPDRKGIEEPSTIGECGWGPRKKARESDVRAKIHQQQCQKMEKTLEGQEAKIERNAKRNCTEGHVATYSVYMSAAKQQIRVF
jgi:hypothetical protein